MLTNVQLATLSFAETKVLNFSLRPRMYEDYKKKVITLGTGRNSAFLQLYISLSIEDNGKKFM